MLGLLAKLWSCSWDGQIFHKDTVIELAYMSLSSASAKFTWHTMSSFVFPLLKYLFHSEEYMLTTTIYLGSSWEAGFNMKTLMSECFPATAFNPNNKWH